MLEKEKHVATIHCGTKDNINVFGEDRSACQVFPRKIRTISPDQGNCIRSGAEFMGDSGFHAFTKIARALRYKRCFPSVWGKPFTHLRFCIVRCEVNGDVPSFRDLRELVLNKQFVDCRGTFDTDFGCQTRFYRAGARGFEHECGCGFHASIQLAGFRILQYSDQRNPATNGSQRRAVSHKGSRHMPPGDST